MSFLSTKAERKLAERDDQLRYLMTITEAINENANVHSLFDIYTESVRHFYPSAEITLCIAEKESIKTLSTFPGDWMEDYLVLYHHYLQNKIEAHYEGEKDFYLPVYHKQYLIALVHFKNIKVENPEIPFLRTITNFVAIAIENKRLFRERVEQENYKTQLALARKIQNSLMPHSFPKTRNLEFNTLYIPHNEVSGDYFDFFHIENSNISLFCIADVAGKGIPAALLMANLQASLRRLSINFTDLETLITDLNEAMYENTKGERMITMFLAAYDVVKNELSYINAGHHYPVMVNRQKKYHFLKKGTIPIGIVAHLPNIQIGKKKIKSDCVIFAYTDGLEQIRNNSGKNMITEGMISVLDRIPFGETEEIADEFRSFIEKLEENEPIADDITVLICKIKTDEIKEHAE